MDMKLRLYGQFTSRCSQTSRTHFLASTQCTCWLGSRDYKKSMVNYFPICPSAQVQRKQVSIFTLSTRTLANPPFEEQPTIAIENPTLQNDSYPYGYLQVQTGCRSREGERGKLDIYACAYYLPILTQSLGTQICSRLIALKDSCKDPATQKTYIKSITGGTNTSSEGFSVSSLESPRRLSLPTSLYTLFNLRVVQVFLNLDNEVPMQNDS